MRYFVFVLLSIAILGGVVWFSGRGSDEPVKTSEMSVDEEQQRVMPTAAINGHMLELEVVRTPEEQALGLSGRESLADNTGMLFVYETPAIPDFWMKEMNFPIDIIWIDENKRIVDITENLVPETFPQTFSPRSPIQYVLEVNANWARGSGISVGDEVKFNDVFKILFFSLFPYTINGELTKP